MQPKHQLFYNHLLARCYSFSTLFRIFVRPLTFPFAGHFIRFATQKIKCIYRWPSHWYIIYWQSKWRWSKYQYWTMIFIIPYCYSSSDVCIQMKRPAHFNQIKIYTFFSLCKFEINFLDICSKHLKIVARHLLQCHCPSSPEFRMDRARCQQAYHLIHWLFPCFWIAIGFEKQTIKIQTVIRRSSHILALIGTFGFFLKLQMEERKMVFCSTLFHHSKEWNQQQRKKRRSSRAKRIILCVLLRRLILEAFVSSSFSVCV